MNRLVKGTSITLMILLILVPITVKVSGANKSILEVMVTGSMNGIDVFKAMKSQLMTLGVVLILVFFLMGVLAKSIEWRASAVLIPTSIFCFLVTLSTYLVRYKSIFIRNYGRTFQNAEEVAGLSDIHLTGFVQRYEGFYMWLSYIVLFLILYLIVKEVRTMKQLTSALILGALIVALVGVLQMTGFSPYKWHFVENLILPMSKLDDGGGLVQRVGKHVVFSTMGNPNIVGSFLVLALPVSLACLFCSKRHTWSVFLFICQSIMFAALLGAKATMAIYGLLLVTIVWLIIRFISISDSRIPIALVAMSWLVIFATTNAYTKDSVSNELFVKSINEVAPKETELNISNLSINEDKDSLHFNIHGTVFMIKYEAGEINCYNDKGVLIPDGIISEKIKIAMEEGNLNPSVRFGHRRIDFSYIEDRFMVSDNAFTYWPVTNEVEYVRLPISYRFGSNRGYIWSRTIPMLDETLLVGYGANTFPVTFPQYDYLGKARYFYSNLVVDKPHNMYLDIWTSFGLIALLAWMTLVGMIWFGNAKKVFITPHVYNDDERWLREGLLMGIAVFLVAGIGYDTTIPTSLYFWTMLGLLSAELKSGRDEPDQTTLETMEA